MKEPEFGSGSKRYSGRKDFSRIWKEKNMQNSEEYGGTNQPRKSEVKRGRVNN